MPRNKRLRKYGKRSQKQSVPTAFGSGSSCIAIVDYMNSVINSTSNAGADVVTSVEVQCNTNTFSAKLRAYASLFTNWRLKYLSVTYLSVLTSTNPGAFAMGYRADPELPAPVTCQGIAQEQDAIWYPIYANGVSKKMVVSVPLRWLKVLSDGIDPRFHSNGFIDFGSVATSAAQFPCFIQLHIVAEFQGQVE